MRILSQHTSMSILNLILLFTLVYSQETCHENDAADGVCVAAATESTTTPHQNCIGMPDSLCRSFGTLYRHFGTAQAYTANAPFKDSVCNVEDAKTQNYKVAGWPVHRRSHRQPPIVSLDIRLWSCDQQQQDCCCRPLASETASTIDIWQARPDGTYSSLRRHHNMNQGDCRARSMVTNGTATIHTLAPGSTGVLGGLGPSKWDFAPFAAPVIHILASAPGHAPTLVDVPVVLDRKTLEQRMFAWKDWRGQGWMNGNANTKEKEIAYRIVKWEANAPENRIRVTLDLYLPTSDQDVSLEKALCPAKLYGLPWSFYKEPIAECAPSLLDFLAL